MPLSRLVRILLALCLCATPLRAQLDLPSSPPKKAGSESGTEAPKSGEKKTPERRGNLVPHLVCTVCYERNYVAPLTSVGKDGLANVYCEVCRRATFHKPSEKQGKGEGSLDLPSAGAPPPAGGRPPADPEPPPLPEGVGVDRAAQFVLDELRNAKSADSELALRAVDSLVALGEPGFEAARRGVFDEHPVVCLCSARVLLRSTRGADRERVVERLRGRVPTRIGTKLLAEVLAADPVHGTPRLLAELLDHQHTAIRNAAYRELGERMSEDVLEDVAGALRSERDSTRARAVELLANLDVERTRELFLGCLGDPSARVADAAASALALSTGEDVPGRLLSVAFEQRWILREGSYALLALVQREDANLEAILGDEHQPALLRGLESTDPFVAGTCATALAGIGFRSHDVEGTAWLERAVPERLVASVSGRTFHADFASLQPHALRRLRLVSGRDFGSDGQAWVRWWLAARPSFYAHRAHLWVDPERVGTLAVHYRSVGEPVEVFNLIGADLAARAHAEPPRAGEQIFLTLGQCRDLIGLLRDEGVLGAERLPGSLGNRGPGERELEILIDGRGKRFLVGEGRAEPWFERVVGALRAVRDRGAWQRYPNPALYADSYEFWRAERDVWATDLEPVERGRRAKTNLMAWVTVQRITQRTAAFRELARLRETPGVARAEDYDWYVDRLREERFLGPRTLDLLAGALDAARLGGADGLVPRELGAGLSRTLFDTFGPGAAAEIAEVLRACGSEHVRETSHDAQPFLRAIAATVLARSSAPADRARLLELLEDEDTDVRVAAMLACGEQKVEEARTELLVRARFAERPLRVPALRAIAHLGGEHVFDALVASRSDTDPLVREAAVEGMAVLGDPRAAPLLISLLARGPEAPAYRLAWDGLLRMGPEAHTDLMQAMDSPTHKARREAALLLARQLRPETTSTLIAMLTDAPGDRELVSELAVLTCVDLSGEKDAALRWWDWWDGVVHDDSLAWFRGVLERAEETVPEASCFRAGGNLEGALFLVSLLDHETPYLAERARRELELMFGRPLQPLPDDAAERAAWIASLRELVLEEWKA